MGLNSKTLFLLLLLVRPLFSNAQPNLAPNTQLPSPEVLGKERPSLPEIKPGEQTKPPKLGLPPITPLPGDNQNLSATLKVFVNHIELTGNSVFLREEFDGITRGYENRIITSNELQELRRKLTQFYVEKGYVNSGAVIPDQKVNDGIIRIHIIEGSLLASIYQETAGYDLVMLTNGWNLALSHHSMSVNLNNICYSCIKTG